MMTERNLKWMLYVIDRLQSLELGDPKRLESIKSKLKNSKAISEDDDQYLFEKLKDLKKIEHVSEPESPKPPISTKKIIQISILVIIIIGAVFLLKDGLSDRIQEIYQNRDAEYKRQQEIDDYYYRLNNPDGFTMNPDNNIKSSNCRDQMINC